MVFVNNLFSHQPEPETQKWCEIQELPTLHLHSIISLLQVLMYEKTLCANWLLFGACIISSTLQAWFNTLWSCWTVFQHPFKWIYLNASLFSVFLIRFFLSYHVVSNRMPYHVSKQRRPYRAKQKTEQKNVQTNQTTRIVSVKLWMACKAYSSVNFVDENYDEKYSLTTFFPWLRRD